MLNGLADTMMTTQTMIHKIIIMDEQETFPTKTERIDELFKKVRELESKINLLETRLARAESVTGQQQILGPSMYNPPGYEEDYIAPTRRSRKIEGNPYDLGSMYKHKHKRK